MKLDDKEQIFIEKLGFHFETHINFPRIAGKIFAFLLISDPPEQTAKQITQKLQISKSSFSSMARLLIQTELLEEITKPGKRSRYYKIKEGVGEQSFTKRLESLIKVREILKDGRSLLEGKNSQLACRIDDLDEAYAFYEEGLSTMITKWREQQQKKNPKKNIRKNNYLR